MVRIDIRSRASSPLLGRPAVTPSPFSRPHHVLRSPAGRVAFVAALLLLALHLGGYLREAPTPAEVAQPDQHSHEAEDFVDPAFDGYDVSQVEPGRTITFRSYLDTVLGPPRSDSAARSIGQLWLTAADRSSVSSWTATLAERIATLNAQRAERARIALVVLCGDGECLEECTRQDWRCYGGFRGTKPLRQGMRPWMQVSGITDVLASGRDVLYVHPGVAVLSDPLSDVSAAAQAADVVAAPQTSSNEISSSFVWTPSTPATNRLWRGVLDELESGADKSVDWLLVRALASEALRDQWDSAAVSSGVAVQLLDGARYGGQDLNGEDVPPVIVPVDCAGDEVMQDYLAKVDGYATTGAYYIWPPKTLVLPELVGKREELEQFLRIAITAAAMLHRALEPPSAVTILSPSSSSSPLPAPLRLSLHDALPLPYLSHALHFALVPPGFSSHPSRSSQSAPPTSKAYDLRRAESIFDLLRALSRAPYAHVQIVRLVGAGTRGATWRAWGRETLPAASAVVALCEELSPRGDDHEESGGAERRCVPRGCTPPAEWLAALTPSKREGVSLGEQRVRAVQRRMEEGWPALEEFLMEGGFAKW